MYMIIMRREALSKEASIVKNLATLQEAIEQGIAIDPVSKDFRVLLNGDVIGFHNHSGWHDVCTYAYSDCPANGNRTSCRLCSEIADRLLQETRRDSEEGWDAE